MGEGGNRRLLWVGLVMALLGLLGMDLGAWEGLRRGHHLPGYYTIAGCLAQVGCVGIAYWHLDRFQGFKKTLAALQWALPVLAVMLMVALAVRVRGGSMASEPFLVVIFFGTAVVAGRMLLTGIALALIGQAAGESIDRWRAKHPK